MKVYTGTGDGGKTSLFSGERIDKSDVRIEAYGCVDELNAGVGVLIAALPEADGADESRSQLLRIQSDLFHIGAWLATTPGSPAVEQLVPFSGENNQWIEDQIDAMDGHLEPINAFILPGGHPSAALAHVCRTVCRRAERRTVRMINLGSGPDAGQDAVAFQGAQEMLVYLNRLSDYFFVLARHCNRLAGEKDVLWHG